MLNTCILYLAEEVARSVSTDFLFNRVMRFYWFGELVARLEDARVDHKLLFLSSVLHNLGLTDHAAGHHRFEIEGASAARRFLMDEGVLHGRAQAVWDDIALHTWDMNLFRDDISRLMELGILTTSSAWRTRSLGNVPLLIEPVQEDEQVEVNPRRFVGSTSRHSEFALDLY